MRIEKYKINEQNITKNVKQKVVSVHEQAVCVYQILLSWKLNFPQN
jgi:hypothetical protein